MPRVFADDAPGLFSGFGWPQARSHGDMLLRLYAQARGRTAELYGEDFVVWDRLVRTMGLHERGAIGYEGRRPDFRANLDAFAAQPGSPHVGDQLVLSANGEMRTAWRTREEIEANLEAREEFG